MLEMMNKLCLNKGEVEMAKKEKVTKTRQKKRVCMQGMARAKTTQ
jgi:hypothetical protein